MYKRPRRDQPPPPPPPFDTTITIQGTTAISFGSTTTDMITRPTYTDIAAPPLMTVSKQTSYIRNGILYLVFTLTGTYTGLDRLYEPSNRVNVQLSIANVVNVDINNSRVQTSITQARTSNPKNVNARYFTNAKINNNRDKTISILFDMRPTSVSQSQTINIDATLMAYADSYGPDAKGPSIKKSTLQTAAPIPSQSIYATDNFTKARILKTVDSTGEPIYTVTDDISQHAEWLRP
jgi:hypothetical protein